MKMKKKLKKRHHMKLNQHYSRPSPPQKKPTSLKHTTSSNKYSNGQQDQHLWLSQSQKQVEQTPPQTLVETQIYITPSDILYHPHAISSCKINTIDLTLDIAKDTASV